MNQHNCQIMAKQQWCRDIFQISLQAPEIAAAAAPGQFVHIKTGADALLRRPFSIHRIDADAGRIEILYRVIGKGTGWLGGTNVPLIMHKPGLVQPGIRDGIVSLADIMPTVLESAGLPIPGNVDGRSLVPYLSGKAENSPRKSLVSCGLHASDWSWFYEGHGERNQQDRRKAPLYVWRIENDKVLMHISETKGGLYKSLPDGIPARTMLYDLATDRHQLIDAAAGYPEQVARFEKGIRQWLGEMEAPITSQQQDYEYLLQETSK